MSEQTEHMTDDARVPDPCACMACDLRRTKAQLSKVTTELRRYQKWEAELQELGRRQAGHNYGLRHES